MFLVTFRADTLDLNFVIEVNFIEIMAVSFITGRQLPFVKVFVEGIYMHFSISALWIFVVNYGQPVNFG